MDDIHVSEERLVTGGPMVTFSPHDRARTIGAQPKLLIATVFAAGLQDAIDLLPNLVGSPDIGFVVCIATDRPLAEVAVILAAHTRLPILPAKVGMRLVANRIHLAPASGRFEIHEGELRLTPDEPAGAGGKGALPVAFARPGTDDLAPATEAWKPSTQPESARAWTPRPLLPTTDHPGESPVAPWPSQRSFFHDSPALFDLQGRLQSSIAANAPIEGAEMRVWILGCGAGEEAYTIAMLASEAIAGTGLPLRVFAADVDAAAIGQARRAVYAREIEGEVPGGHLARYFVVDGSGWRVKQELRESVVFGTYDPTLPSLSRMDLVACRHMFASLPADQRSKLLEDFPSAVKPGGLLLLGPRDQVTEIPGFEALATTPGLFRRTFSPPEASALAPPRAVGTPFGMSSLARGSDLGLAMQAAAEAFVPPSVLVNGSGRILATVGAVEGFLEGGGGPSWKRLLSAAAPWLRRGMAQAIDEARHSQQAVSFRALPDLDGSHSDLVTVRVQPVRHGRTGMLLISFLSPEFLGLEGELSHQAQQARIAALEKEMEALHLEIDKLRFDIAMEQQDSILHFEEAQSLQEELTLSMDELTSQVRALELTEAELRKEAQRHHQSTGELQNTIASSGMAFLLLDSGLNIRFFISSERLPFRIIASDIGRPLADIAPLASDPDLLDEALIVLSTRETLSRELEGPDGTWLMRRIYPYPEVDETAGVVINYSDIRETKAAALRAEAFQGMAADMVRAHHQPLVLLDPHLHPLFMNQPFRDMFGGDGYDVGLRMVMGAALRAAPGLSTFLTNRDDRAGRIDDCVIQVSLPVFGPRTLRLVASRIPPGRTLLALDDITERVLLAATVEKAQALAERVSRDKARLLASVSQELRQPIQDVEGHYRAYREGEKDAGLSRQTKRLGFAVNEVTGILDALQDGAQLDLGTFDVTTSAFPLATVLARIDADFADRAGLQQVRWRVIGSERVIFSDPQILQRTLRHVVSILLRYTPVTRILLGCRPRGNLLRVEIRAQGFQIPFPTLRAGLEPQKDGHIRSEGTEGMRIGLDVARRFGELLGHHIRIEAPSPNQVVLSMGVPTALRSPSAAAARVSPDSVGHVLILSGDPEAAATLRLLLEREGCAAIMATDAAQAISLAVEFPPALIIAEYDLPGSMNGLDLARRIAGRRDPAPAALLLIGDVDTSTIHSIDAAGFRHAPLTAGPEDLLERVQDLLPSPNGAATVPAEPGQIFIVDGDGDRRLSLRGWLEGQGWTVKEFTSAEAFLEGDTSQRRGGVLADWSSVENAGDLLLEALQPLAHRLPVIALGDQGDVRLAVSAMSAGAIDFVQRPIQRDALMRSLAKATARIAEGQQQAASRQELSSRLASLTQRQSEILDRILAGAPNKIIAADLKLSQRTVENHRASLMAKLGARSLPELLRIVMRAR